MSLIGRPKIWEDSRDGDEGKDYLTKPLADVLYMNTNEPYTSNLDMTGNRIVNVGDPTDDKDAVNKKYFQDNLASLGTKEDHEQYVNTHINTRLSLSGGTMTGDVNMNNKKITNVAVGSNSDAVNKQYVDNKANTISDNAPVIITSRFASILSTNGSIANHCSSYIENDVFLNNTPNNVIITASTNLSSGSLENIIIVQVIYYYITDNKLWYEMYIYNAPGSRLKKNNNGQTFDVIVRVLAFKSTFQSVSYSNQATFRSGHNSDDIRNIDRETDEASINVETESNSSPRTTRQQNSNSQSRSHNTNVANSYI